ncbi:hypothetical protein RF11_08025 [Thelohanellus kitauei]|uniref:Uncharacterized protein n=1 Tax=Thelohanellus kitauei TaxID=669202 RepID=A0A0C2MLQ3_THEKT|nr:hypothetical protein RF11_08025 [Thelohanellus kitauei]
MLLEYNWMPSIITCDFEISLITAIRNEFPQSQIQGCYFHLQQSITRKLKKFPISTADSSIILQNIELLTLVPLYKISKAMEFIKSKTSKDNRRMTFWFYFENTWLKRFDPSIWNTSTKKPQELIRTNNGLERYNRRFYEFFANSHPNIHNFVNAIRSEFIFYEQQLIEARQTGSSIKFKEEKSTSGLLEDFNKVYR